MTQFDIRIEHYNDRIWHYVAKLIEFDISMLLS